MKDVMKRIPRIGRRAGAAMASVAIMQAAAMSANAAEFFDGRVNLDFALMEAFQKVDVDDGAFNPANESTDSGFQRLRLSAALTVDFTDYITGFVEFAEEPNDFGDGDTFGGDFNITNDLSFIDVRLLEAFNSAAAEDSGVMFRIGQEVPRMFNFRGYSDGAVVQGNPLVGNSTADFVTAETGVGLYLSHNLPDTSAIDSLGLDLRATVPTFDEDFSDDRGYHFNTTGRIGILPDSSEFGGLRVGGAFSYIDGSDQFQTTGNAGGVNFGGTPSGATGMVFGDGDNYNFPGTAQSTRDGHAGLIPGIDMTMWQVDAEYTSNMLPLTLRGWFGMGEDEFSFVDSNGVQTTATNSVGVAEDGVQDSEMRWFGVTAVYDILPDKWYIAGRYTQVNNTSSNIDDDEDRLARIQVGTGVFLTDKTLIKAEYVNQNEDAQSPGQIGSDWQGGQIEFSVAF